MGGWRVLPGFVEVERETSSVRPPPSFFIVKNGGAGVFLTVLVFMKKNEKATVSPGRPSFTGVPHFKENAPPRDPTVGLCLVF